MKYMIPNRYLLKLSKFKKDFKEKTGFELEINIEKLNKDIDTSSVHINEFINEFSNKYPFVPRAEKRLSNGLNSNIFKYILFVKYNLTAEEIGQILNKHRTTIYKSFNTVKGWISVKDESTLNMLKEFDCI